MSGWGASAGGGTWALCWTQTEAEGIPAPPAGVIAPGSSWRWTGEATRIEAPFAPLRLDRPAGADTLRLRAARIAPRLSGLAPRRSPEPEDAPPARGFAVTDGLRRFAATVVAVPGARWPVVCFDGPPPSPGRDLWVVEARLEATDTDPARPAGGVICFTPGTRLAVPGGTAAIEDLRPGDLVQTADDGPQPVIWTGRRVLSGARLYAMPQLRPVRIRAGAFGAGRPDAPLVVSPQHRLLVRGRAARALWGEAEVLVEAAHLVDDRRVTVDLSARGVTYIHILFAAHQVVFANGVETESFHPAAAAEGSLDPADAALLEGALPDPARYGGFARRPLNAAEAAILRHEGGRAAAA